MKFVVFGDIHGDLFALEEVRHKCNVDGVEIAICIGDLSYFEHDLDFLLEVLNDFPVPVLIIHGNHELKENVELITSYLPNLSFVHKKIIKMKNFNFMFYGGDGFSKLDKEFEEWSNKEIKKLDVENTILFLHGPPYNTKLDVPYDNHHCGNKSTKKFLEKQQILMSVSGHVHEGENLTDFVGKTFLINPGPLGMIIDLKDIQKQRELKN
ncbi:MAG: metallophosphoesterase [Candidatus Woesearchaeota archaeon]